MMGTKITINLRSLQFLFIFLLEDKKWEGFQELWKTPQMNLKDIVYSFTQNLWRQTNSEKSNLSANHDGVIFQKSLKSVLQQQSIFSVLTARVFWSISNLWQSPNKQRAQKSAILAIFHFRKVAYIFKFDRGQPTLNSRKW